MEIISGDAAYRITEEFRQDALNKVINEYAEIFNKEISSAALRGSDFCLVGWKDLGITSHPSDEDFYNLAAFVDVLMQNYYEVEYYFHNPRHHDVSGVVVAWGPKAAARIDQFFEETQGCFYRGEEIGVH